MKKILSDGTHTAIRAIETESGESFTVLVKDVLITLKNGTVAVLGEITTEFVGGYLEHIKSMFISEEGIASLINEIGAGVNHL